MFRMLIVIVNVLINMLYRIVRRLNETISQWSSMGYLYRKGASVSPDAKWLGGVKLNISCHSDVQIGKAFICRGKGNGIDVSLFSNIVVNEGARLIIGNYSGMSNTSIHCQQEITIGDHVNIGGGCMIFDTNFHSINWRDRDDRQKDVANKKTAPIHIGNYVFIGARSIICKGVSIGDRSIIAAGSVCIKNIPPDCIAGGNPCKVIKMLEK